MNPEAKFVTPKSKSRSLFVVVILVLLGACSTVPLTTMWKLRNFDALTADPAVIHIAVITDQIVQLRDDAVSLSLGFTSKNSQHSFNTQIKATLKTKANIAQLNKYLSEKQHITLFYLD